MSFMKKLKEKESLVWKALVILYAELKIKLENSARGLLGDRVEETMSLLVPHGLGILGNAYNPEATEV